MPIETPSSASPIPHGNLVLKEIFEAIKCKLQSRGFQMFHNKSKSIQALLETAENDDNLANSICELIVIAKELSEQMPLALSINKMNEIYNIPGQILKKSENQPHALLSLVGAFQSLESEMRSALLARFEPIIPPAIEQESECSSSSETTSFEFNLFENTSGFEELSSELKFGLTSSAHSMEDNESFNFSVDSSSSDNEAVKPDKPTLSDIEAVKPDKPIFFKSAPSCPSLNEEEKDEFNPLDEITIRATL